MTLFVQELIDQLAEEDIHFFRPVTPESRGITNWQSLTTWNHSIYLLGGAHGPTQTSRPELERKNQSENSYIIAPYLLYKRRIAIQCIQYRVYLC